MNLTILPTYAMLAITRGWLDSPQLAAEMSRRRLGEGLWEELGRAHERLSVQQRDRMAIESEIAALSAKIVELGTLHDDHVRGLHALLYGLAATSTDAAFQALCHKLVAVLFPETLRVIKFSLQEKAGAIVSLEHRVTATVLDKLQGIAVGERTLADVFHAWVAAGKALQRRRLLKASLGRGGSKRHVASPQKARFEWIRTVRMLLGARDMLDLSRQANERLMALLCQAVATAEKRRTPGNPDLPAPSDDASAPPDEMEDAPDALAEAPDMLAHFAGTRGHDAHAIRTHANRSDTTGPAISHALPRVRAADPLPSRSPDVCGSPP